MVCTFCLQMSDASLAEQKQAVHEARGDSTMPSARPSTAAIPVASRHLPRLRSVTSPSARASLPKIVSVSSGEREG